MRKVEVAFDGEEGKEKKEEGRRVEEEEEEEEVGTEFWRTNQKRGGS